MNQTQPDGSTPLHWAVYKVDRELVAALLRRGARADAVNKYGASPLSEAARVANLELAGMLVEAGANANVANEDGQTPLMLAARTGNVAVAKLLVQHGADVNRRERYRDQSAVMWAAAEGHGEMVEFLVAQKADLTVRARANDWETQISSEPRVQYRPTGGLTPLLYAARAGCLRCVAAIVGAGADVDRPNPDGMTPMIMALDNGAPGGGAVPARPRRQPAHVGLVGPHAAVRRGDDARRPRQPLRSAASGVAGVHQGSCSPPA